MTKRDFSAWFDTFKQSINRYDYYIDFNKVYENARRYKVEINILNSLIGSKNIETEFKKIITKYPECLQVIPTLLAVRANKIYCQDTNGEHAIIYDFDNNENSVNQYLYFMHKTGLFDLMQGHIISNLYDYVTGVEVGLDSNGRKNRGGHQMEHIVEQYLKRANADYYKEMYLSEIEKKWHVNLSVISAGGTTKKRFDFVVHTNECIFLIETNFYTGGGSKLNETARSYKLIAEETRSIKDVEFIWVTDGLGWNSAKGNLKETFDVLETLYNINDLENGSFDILFNQPKYK